MGQRKPIYSSSFHALDPALLQPWREEFTRQLISKENSIHACIPLQIDMLGSHNPPTELLRQLTWGLAAYGMAGVRTHWILALSCPCHRPSQDPGLGALPGPGLRDCLEPRVCKRLQACPDGTFQTRYTPSLSRVSLLSFQLCPPPPGPPELCPPLAARPPHLWSSHGPG